MFLANLRAFYETSRLNSIRRASQELGVAPSTISRQIAILERQVGANLLDRTAQGVSLNYAGEMVGDFARRVLLDFDALKTDLDDYKGGRRALIKIAAVESIVCGGPAEAIARFQQTYREVKFDLRMMSAPAVVEAVAAAEVDIGFSFSPAPHPDLQVGIKVDEPLVLVLPRSSDFPEQASVQLRDLAAFSLALPSAEFGVRRIIDTACRDKGLALNTVFASNSFEAIRHFVTSGGGAAVLPSRAMIGKDNTGLRFVRIVDKSLPPTTLEGLTLKGRRMSRLLRAFIQQLYTVVDANRLEE